MKYSKHKIGLILIFLLLYSYSSLLLGQNVLKMGASGGPAGNGPSTNNQVVTLYKNGTIVFTPTVTVTYSLSNQQFPSGTVEGISQTGLTFGATGSGSGGNNTMGTFPIYTSMNGISSPTNAMFSGCSVCGQGNGTDVTVDKSISIFTCSDALINASTNNLFPLNSRVYYGDLTLTFNRPVTNPILQIVGLGGHVEHSNSTTVYYQAFATEFDLVGGLTFTKLAGNTAFNVTSTQITNSSTWLGANSQGSTSYGVTRYAASGSVQVSGVNITTITLKVYLRGDGGRVSDGSGNIVPPANGLTPYWSLGATNPIGSGGFVAGDLLHIGASIEEPYENCTNVFDDDWDGSMDCADTDCQPTILSVSSANPNCPVGTNNGTITVSASVPTGSVEYRLNTGAYQSSNVFTNLAAGTYTITVRKVGTACTATSSKTLTAPSCPENCTDGIDNDGDGFADCLDTDCKPVISSVSSNNPTCPTGTVNGTITVFATVTSGTLEYSLNSGTYQSSNVFTGLSSGTYIVTVRKVGTNCTATSSRTLTAPSCPEDCTDGIDNDGDGFTDCLDTDCKPVISTVNSVNPTCPTGSNNGTITITASVGSGSLQYRLNSGAYQSSNVFTGLAPGSYTITVQKVGTSCTATSSKTLATPSCVENCTDGIDNDGDGFTDCLDTDCKPTISNVSFVNPNCPTGTNNGSITVTATVPSGSVEYSLNSGAYQSSNTFSGLAPGSYTITVRRVGTSCTATSSKTLTTPSCPENCTDGIDNDGDGFTDCLDADCKPVISTVSSSNPTCPTGTNNGTITVTATVPSGSLEYRLNSGAYQSSNVFSALASGSYTIEVRKVGTTCIATSSKILSAPSCVENCTDGIDNDGDGFIDCLDADCKPVISNINPTNPSCPTGTNNGAIVVTATISSGSLEYRINSGTYQSSNTFSSLAPGSYTVEVRRVGTTCTVSSTTTLSTPSCSENCTDGIDNDGDGFTDCLDTDCKPVISTVNSTNPACPVGTNNGTITVSATVASGALEYSLNSGTYQSSNIFTNLAAGTYSITVRKVGTTCTATSSKTLTAPSCPENCTDGIDNDGDGFTDCLDSDCKPTISSVTPTNPSCPTGTNNGSITVNATVLNGSAEYRVNGGSYQNANVFTGLGIGTYTIEVRKVGTACTSTWSSAVTLTAPTCLEICNDGLDNDGDGWIDCADTDCKVNIATVNLTPPTCANKTGGQIVINATSSSTLSYSIKSIASWQASNTFSSLGVGQYFIRVQNNSGCSAVYSSNPVIFDFSTCVEICNDGIDNDGDGFTDCDDPDCENVGAANKIEGN
jgi:hypothetical protein